MSFFVADRRFYQSDVAAGLYAPSAYYLAAVTASEPAGHLPVFCSASPLAWRVGYLLHSLVPQGVNHSVILSDIGM